VGKLVDTIWNWINSFVVHNIKKEFLALNSYFTLQ